MPAFIIDLTVIGTVCYLAWLGSDRGIFEMAALGLQLLVSVILGILLLEPVASMIGDGLLLAFGPFLPEGVAYEAWGLFLGFMLLVWLPFMVLFTNLHPRIARDCDMRSVTMIEKIGGAIVGGLDGILVLGAALITLSILPFFDGLKVNGNSLHFDVGKVVLSAAGGFAGEWHEGRSLVMLGEPPSRESVATARLSSEPRCDLDADGAPSEADRFCDVDENGIFTKDLYYDDIDGDSARRVGMIEKYVVGRWDADLVTMDRDRPKPERAGNSAPAPPAATAQTPPPSPPAAKPEGGAQPAPVAPPKKKVADAEEEIVVLVDEDGNIISEEEMAEGDVEIVEEVVEEVVEDGGTPEKKP